MHNVLIYHAHTPTHAQPKNTEHIRIVQRTKGKLINWFIKVQTITNWCVVLLR